MSTKWEIYQYHSSNSCFLFSECKEKFSALYRRLIFVWPEQLSNQGSEKGKKVSSQIASAYTSSLMLLLVAEKNLIGVKSGQNPPQFYLKLVCNSHLITWLLLIGQLEHIVTVASWSIANNFVIDFYCRCLEIFMPNCNKL